MLAVFLIWSATAAASPTFGVMNADGGIYWRSAPTWSAAEATPGNGIYPDSIIAPICYEAGAADVPGSGDDMWELATVVGGSGSGTGFVNEHFIDDSQAINTPSPGSPPCGSSTSSPAPPAAAAPTAPTPPTSAPASPPAAIYFSPFSSTDSRTWLRLGDQSVATVYSDQWESQCTLPRLAYTAALAKLAPGQTIGTLAGWSAGRLGPIDFLANATPTQEQQLNYIILIDPGNESDLSGCDRFMDAGDLLAGWLRANPDAHLAVISSSVISQQNNSQGIQETYFNAIRNQAAEYGQDLQSRVLTCNYSLDHYHAFFAGQYWIAHDLGTTSCPTLSDGSGTYPSTAGWHP